MPTSSGAEHGLVARFAPRMPLHRRTPEAFPTKRARKLRLRLDRCREALVLQQQ
jgi:hypothetical protein